MPPRTAAPRMPRATQGTIYRKGQAPKGATAAAPDSDDSDAEELVKSDVEEAEHEEVRGKDGLVIRREPATAVPLKVKELDLKPRLVTRPIGELCQSPLCG